MAFFQTDLEPFYLRENHNRQDSAMKGTKQGSTTPPVLEGSYKWSLESFFGMIKNSNSNKSQMTTESMNRLVSFHL